ncbi:hypothetical protein SORBI_3004G090400 [Sorghum bicolor]|uniref:Embryo surrounding factor 1 brassicaceae domain-containing protein n=1 Tax=Sorghum bicolor TaxID=4558 RepID=A0A194YPN5_SORBI|nr:hypothetical protein SORBI_3004G090400 [Sorghum bicolor]
MDHAKLRAVLFVVFLACLQSSSWCEGDDSDQRWTGGEITPRSRVTIVLCLKTLCKPHWKLCYCCQTLPNWPCYLEHKACLDICPHAFASAPSPQPLLAPAPHVGPPMVR